MDSQNYNTGFTTAMIDRSHKFYKAALKQIKWMKKIQGVRVEVERIAKDSKYRTVLKGLYTSTNIGDDEIINFPYVALIQINDMKRLFLKQIDQLDFFDNEYILEKGDIISYCHGNTKFQFKISEVTNFSDVDGILYQYTLMGIKETKTEEVIREEKPEVETNIDNKDYTKKSKPIVRNLLNK